MSLRVPLARRSDSPRRLYRRDASSLVQSVPGRATGHGALDFGCCRGLVVASSCRRSVVGGCWLVLAVVGWLLVAAGVRCVGWLVGCQVGRWGRSPVCCRLLVRCSRGWACLRGVGWLLCWVSLCLLGCWLVASLVASFFVCFLLLSFMSAPGPGHREVLVVLVVHARLVERGPFHGRPTDPRVDNFRARAVHGPTCTELEGPCGPSASTPVTVLRPVASLAAVLLAGLGGAGHSRGRRSRPVRARKRPTA